jgi:hypothetical protein
VRRLLPRPTWDRESPEAEVPAAVGPLRAAQRKRVAAIRKLNARYAGQAFPRRAAEKWNRLQRELDETEELITQLRACGGRHDQLDRLGRGRAASEPNPLNPPQAGEPPIRAVRGGSSRAPARATPASPGDWSANAPTPLPNADRSDSIGPSTSGD